MPPPVSGWGASRVHNTMPSGSGSPEATPSENGYELKNIDTPLWRSASAGRATADAPSAHATFIRSRLDSRLSARSYTPVGFSITPPRWGDYN